MRVGMGDRARTISMAHPGSRSSRKGGTCQVVRASGDSAFCCVRPLASRGRRRRTYGGIESAHTLAPAPEVLAHEQADEFVRPHVPGCHFNRRGGFYLAGRSDWSCGYGECRRDRHG